jgi:hypothetical protein
MAYRWQKTADQQLVEVIRQTPITFDSWLLITEDPTDAPQDGTPRNALWFTSLDELTLFVEERFLSLWLPKEASTEAIVAATRKLSATRRIQKRLISQFRDKLNEALSGRVHVLWIGTFSDLLGNDEPEVAQISSDLEFWFHDRSLEPGEIDLEVTKQQKAAVEFFLQLGS